MFVSLFCSLRRVSGETNLLVYEIVVCLGILMSFHVVIPYSVPQYVISGLIKFVSAEVSEVREVYNKSGATSSHSGGVACFTQISKLHEKEDLETGHIRSDYRNGGRHDALLSGVLRPYSDENRRGRGRGSYNKGYDGRSRKSKDGEGGYGSFPRNILNFVPALNSIVVGVRL
ncbi:hypothetical protein Tco_0237049 [Tanacetum coccineum]